MRILSFSAAARAAVNPVQLPKREIDDGAAGRPDGGDGADGADGGAPRTASRARAVSDAHLPEEYFKGKAAAAA